MFNLMRYNLSQFTDENYVENKKNLIFKILLCYLLVAFINFILVIISASTTFSNHHTTLFIVTIINLCIIVPYLFFVGKHIHLLKLSNILLNSYDLKNKFKSCIKITNVKSIVNCSLVVTCIVVLSVALTNDDNNDQIIIAIYSYFLVQSVLNIICDRYIMYLLKNIIIHLDTLYPNSTPSMLED